MANQGGVVVVGGTGGASQFSELDDVAAVALANRQAWLYNSGTGKWVNRLLVTADLPDLSGTYSPVGHNHDATYVNEADHTLGAHTALGLATDADLDAESIARAAADALLIPLTQKAAASGVATLDGSGKIPTSQLPALAITDTFPVASQAAMLALAAETGDVAIRSDVSKSFILKGADPTNLAHWQELLTPTDTVLSVNGETGAVTLDAADVGAQPVDTDLTAIAALAPADDTVIQRKAGIWVARSMAQIKTDLALAKADVGLANADNTSDVNKPVSTAQQAAIDLKVSKSLYDANTILKADADDTPSALTVLEQRLVGRITGGVITGLTAAEVKTLIALVAAALPSHGAAQHDDVTRPIWIPGIQWIADGATLTAAGGAPNAIRIAQMADAATQGIYFDFNMPADAKAASPLNIKLYFSPGGASVNPIVFSVAALNIAAAADTSAAGTTTQWTETPVTSGANSLNISAARQILATVNANELVKVSVRRLGADGADTNTNTARLYMVVCEYTAVQ